MQRCASLKEHMRKVIDYVFCALCMVRPGKALSWNRQDCNRQSMQRVQNTWSIGTGLCFKCSDTNVVFQTAIFLIPVVRNNKRSSGIDGKTSDCLSRNCLYYRYLILSYFILSYVSASNFSLNRLNLWLLFFFADFLMVKVLFVKNYQIKLLKNIWYILLQ